MRRHISTITFKSSPLSDVSKLCFASAAGFAGVGSVSYLFSQLIAGFPQADSLLMISAFYVLLGIVEQVRSSHSSTVSSIDVIDADENTSVSRTDRSVKAAA